MSESIETICKRKFRHLSDQELVRRINGLPDFGYDDEEVELHRRINENGLKVQMNINTLEIIRLTEEV